MRTIQIEVTTVDNRVQVMAQFNAAAEGTDAENHTVDGIHTVINELLKNHPAFLGSAVGHNEEMVIKGMQIASDIARAGRAPKPPDSSQ